MNGSTSKLNNVVLSFSLTVTSTINSFPHKSATFPAILRDAVGSSKLLVTHLIGVQIRIATDLARAISFKKFAIAALLNRMLLL